MSTPPSLGHRASRGIAVTMGGTWTKTVLQMAAIMLLGRLLSPEDFGLVAMVTAVSGVIDLVRDFGLTGAIIQARRITDRAWRSLFWLGVALGVGLGGILAGCAPVIAALYGQPELVLITLALAPTLLVNGIAMPLQARATRELRFGLLARIDVVTMAVGVAAALGAALLGWGYWALVLMVGVQLVVRLIMLWVALPPRPGWPRIHRDVLPLLSRGGSIFGAELLNYVERNADTVIVGQQLGAAVLGQYSRAYALLILPQQQLNAPLGRVALPVLSSLQDDPDRYRRYIRAALLVVGYVTFPTYAVLATVSGPLFAILLGPGWDLAADIFSILALAGIANSLGKVRGWLFITMGRSHQQFLFDLVARPIVVVGFFVGVWWGGVTGMALGYGILSALLLIPGFAVAIRRTFVRASDVVVPVLRPLGYAVLAYGAAFAATRAVDLPAVADVAVGVLAGLVALGPLLLIPAYRRDVRQLLGYVARVRAPRDHGGPRPARSSEGRATRSAARR